MRAAVMVGACTDLEVRTVADVEPLGLDDTLVAVDACGICGTDLHILDGAAYEPNLPFVLGHEPVGTVVAVGDDGNEDLLGRRVTITLFTGCGICPWCRTGDERLCPDLVSITGVLNSWGGFAELMRVRAAQLVCVPDQLLSVDAAILVDAGATAHNAVRKAAYLRREPGAAVVVGGGPVGFLVAGLSRRLGYAVEVIEEASSRREAVAAAGFVAVPELADVTEQPQIIFDCSGAPDIPGAALAALAPHGALLTVAYGTVPALDTSPVARKELSIQGIRSGSRDDLVEVLALAASGELTLPTASIWPLEGINLAFSALREGSVAGKAVIRVAAGDGQER